MRDPPRLLVFRRGSYASGISSLYYILLRSVSQKVFTKTTGQSFVEIFCALYPHHYSSFKYLFYQENWFSIFVHKLNISMLNIACDPILNKSKLFPKLRSAILQGLTCKT